MRPLRNNLIVEIEENLSNTAGLIIPHNSDKWKEAKLQLSCRGRIIAVGEGKRHKKTAHLGLMQCKTGDKIAFSEIQYPSILENGKKYVIINEQDVLGIER